MAMGRLGATTPLQRAAITAALLNVIVLLMFQFVVSEGSAPLALFVLFVGIWIFGAVMLVVAPRFGAAGTAAWGLLAAGAAYNTHRSLDASNLTIILLSLTGALAALAFLWERMRGAK